MHVRRDVLHKIYIRLKLEMQEEEEEEEKEEGEGGENEQQFFFFTKSWSPFSFESLVLIQYRSVV